MKIDNEKRSIAVDIPITTTMAKIRIKSRNSVYDYGTPFASRTFLFHENNYVEWQVGYDILTTDAPDMSTLPNISFVNNQGDVKSLYEFSEILYYFCEWNVISRAQIRNLLDDLSTLNAHDFIDNHPECNITRSAPEPKNINNINFQQMWLKYPKLIYKFTKDEIVAEIIIREKQRAIGVQPMLYFCFPITELTPCGSALIGRCANPKEVANFVFNDANSHIILDMTKIFGMLSKPT